MELIADTTFLVGLWRRQSWAVDFARANQQRILGIPWVVFGEFWHGAKAAGHDENEVRRFLHMGLPIWDTAPVIPHYASICCQVRESGFYNMIGQNDLWIAAIAIERSLPLVTKNRRHFDKIRGLRLEVLCPEK